MRISQQYQVPFGKSLIKFEIPPKMKGTVVTSRQVKPLKDAQREIKKALDAPLGSPKLNKLASQGQRVCIVFTDITRPSPDHLLVPAMLEELEQSGVRDEDVTLLCGTGMHRASTQEDRINKLGSPTLKRYRVIDNEPQNSSAMVDLGTTNEGIPILIHRAAIEADLLIATGVVEPHQYAGYSGGCKTLAIGAAGEALIGYTHGPAFVDHPGTRLGRIDDNPFQRVVTKVARMARLQFILNVVLDQEKRILHVAAGDPDQAFNELVTFARSIYETPIPHQYDIVIGGVGYPKDSNLYQASRAPTHLYFAPSPVVRPGGFLIIPARCEEGAGTGVGEQRFLSAMRDAPDIDYILNDARQNGYPPGQQRAFVLAKVLEQTRIVIVGSEYPDLVADCKMIPAATINEAFSLAVQSLGNSCQVLIVPHATLTLPVIHPKRIP